MPKCGSQIILCDVPIRFDPYKGCSHGCRYCFVQRKSNIENITIEESAKNLSDFISGKRNNQTAWCDWNIPLHIGGTSDPFQPIEDTKKVMLECLKILAETQYPFIVSTKGRLCCEEPYLSLLSECNAVIQISMACASYDKLEPGAPNYAHRLEMVRTLSPKVKRVIIRVQPYMHECFDEIKNNISAFADAGAYGVIFEGIKFMKKKPGLVKIGGDYCYPLDTLKRDFSALKNECHKNNMRFYSGENRLRYMGDSLTCCGIDGIEGFKVNTFNYNHFINDANVPIPTEAQLKKGTAAVWGAIEQRTVCNRKNREKSLYTKMLEYLSENKSKIYVMFGKESSENDKKR